MEPARERTYTWTDPEATARRHTELSGLEFVTALLRGESENSPLSRTLGFTVTAAAPGRVELSLEPAEFLYNAVGSLHGGALSAVADTAMGFAVSTTLPARTGYTTLDLTVRFTRPATSGSGTVTVTGLAEHTGRRTAVARAEARDARGRLLATASSTCLILRAG